MEFDGEAKASSGVNGDWWLTWLIPVDSASQELGWGLGKVKEGSGKVVARGIEAQRGVHGRWI